MAEHKLILVTGATGYVGTRLVPALLAAGHRVRCMARDPAVLSRRPWIDAVEVMRGDVTDAASLPPALAGVRAAYYLIHNMASGWSYRDHERTGARNFAAAAKLAGLEQIVYVGGLGQGSGTHHMASRREAGEILRGSGVPSTEFRASVIIGSGSISFEMIRFITEWLPLIPAPIQTNVLGQPVGIRDLLDYLLAALDNPAALGRIFEVGGTDAFSYPTLMEAYARERGLKRPKLPMPFFNAFLSAWLADLLTPVPFNIARPLMEELVAESIVTDDAARRLFPSIALSSYIEAMRRALAREEHPAGSAWSSTLVTRRPLTRVHVRTLGEGLLMDYRERGTDSIPEQLQLLLNGRAAAGWAVEAGTPGTWVRLRAARKIPGVLWREIRLESRSDEGFIADALMFEPRGLAGFIYWYLIRPLEALWTRD